MIVIESWTTGKRGLMLCSEIFSSYYNMYPWMASLTKKKKIIGPKQQLVIEVKLEGKGLFLTLNWT